MAEASDSGMIGPAVTHGIILKNDEREHARLHEAVDAFAKRSAFSEAEKVALQFCLEEAFLNIVKYGFDDVDEHEIDVQLHFLLDKRVLVIWIVDDGNTLESFDRDSPQELDQLVRDQSSGKLGLYLVRKYTRHVSYCREGGYNHLILSKKISD